MTKKVMENLYRLTGGKPLKEIPVQLLKTSCSCITMDSLSDKLGYLESFGHINICKKTVEGKSRIFTVELTTYGKSITQNLLERDSILKKLE